eukprot:TRINITY_DN2292_c0_g2_i3.p1 TRINITY_DN2292_c0_g2~~TRINITY_DN2292_c0_g2_i3.p1  ORF type:complete len:949 (+),score=211.36 TRINITY_DN2292_c0_g2_i3:220-3066(+)
MLAPSNLVNLESLDKQTLIQMVTRYRQKEELQKARSLGLSTLSTGANPTMVTSTENSSSRNESPRGDRQLKRSKSVSVGNSGEVGSGREKPPQRKSSVTFDQKKPSVPAEKKVAYPNKEKSKSKKPTLTKKFSRASKLGEKRGSHEPPVVQSPNSSERHPTPSLPASRVNRKSISGTHSPVTYQMQKETSLKLSHSSESLKVSHSSSTKQTLVNLDKRGIINLGDSAKNPQLITKKELQEDTPMRRQKIARGERKVISFLNDVGQIVNAASGAYNAGNDYVQKMYQISIVLNGMKDQFPSDDTTKGELEAIVVKISDLLTDFQALHLAMLTKLKEEFIMSINEAKEKEIVVMEALSQEYLVSTREYDASYRRYMKKVNSRNLNQCMEEMEPHQKQYHQSSINLCNKLNEFEIFGKVNFLSHAVDLLLNNLEYVSSSYQHYKQNHDSFALVSHTLNETVPCLKKMNDGLSTSTTSLTHPSNDFDSKSCIVSGNLFFSSPDKKGKWEPAYFSVDYGYFIQIILTENNKMNKKRWNLLMSSVKPRNDLDRSFAMEITMMSVQKTTTSQTMYLQAESEEMRTRWITVITNAVMELLSHTRNTNENSRQKTRIKLPNHILKHIQLKNATCADCGDSEPDWASINLGVLFCRNCSGSHRAMGTSISKVRSITIDNWDIQSIKLMEVLGNTKVNSLLLANQRDHQMTLQQDRESYIRKKYEHKEWIKRDTNPSDLVTRLFMSVQTKNVLLSLSYILQGANVNATNEENFTPLHLAIYKKQHLQAQLCIANGAKVDQKGGPRLDTSLHIASRNLDPIAIALLISSGGASISEKNADGKTPEEVAKSQTDTQELNQILKNAYQGFDPSPLDASSYLDSSSSLEETTEIESKVEDSITTSSCEASPSEGGDEEDDVEVEGDDIGENSSFSMDKPTTTPKPGDRILSMFTTLQEGNEMQ